MTIGNPTDSLCRCVNRKDHSIVDHRGVLQKLGGHTKKCDRHHYRRVDTLSTHSFVWILHPSYTMQYGVPTYSMLRNLHSPLSTWIGFPFSVRLWTSCTICGFMRAVEELFTVYFYVLFQFSLSSWVLRLCLCVSCIHVFGCKAICEDSFVWCDCTLLGMYSRF